MTRALLVCPEPLGHKQPAGVGIRFLEMARVLRGAFDETQTTVQSLYAEVRRLQGLLDMIYASRTWKLHSIVEKVKGR